MRFLREFLRKSYEKLLMTPLLTRRLYFVGFLFSATTAIITYVYSQLTPKYPVYESYSFTITNHSLAWSIRLFVVILYFIYIFYRIFSDQAIKDFKVEVARDPSLPFFVHLVRAFNNSAEFQSFYLGICAYLFLLLSLWSSLTTALLAEFCFNFYLFSNLLLYYLSSNDSLVLEQAMQYGSRLVASKKNVAIAIAIVNGLAVAGSLGLENKRINVESRRVDFEVENKRTQSSIESKKLDIESKKVDIENRKLDIEERKLQQKKENSGRRWPF